MADRQLAGGQIIQRQRRERSLVAAQIDLGGQRKAVRPQSAQ
jgi:hypothetical protein